MINFLLTLNYKNLQQYALKLVGGNSSDAEDLTQETSLRILENKLRIPQEPTEFFPWASRVMKNIYLNSLRRTPMCDLDDIEEPSFEDNIFGENIIDLLPDHLKECCKLTMEGYKQKEISEKLEIPEGTVKSRMYGVKKILRNRIKYL